MWVKKLGGGCRCRRPAPWLGKTQARAVLLGVCSQFLTCGEVYLVAAAALCGLLVYLALVGRTPEPASPAKG